MQKSYIVQQILYLTFPQWIFVFHLQTSLVLDNAFLFLKSTEPIIGYQFLNKPSFWAERVYKKIQLCLKGKNYCNCALRWKVIHNIHNMIKNWLFTAKHCQEHYVLIREADRQCTPRLGACPRDLYSARKEMRNEDDI